MKRGETGPMLRKCHYYPDEIIRALATNAEISRKNYLLMNRKDRRKLAKYYQMYLKGTLRYV